MHGGQVLLMMLQAVCTRADIKAFQLLHKAFDLLCGQLVWCEHHSWPVYTMHSLGTALEAAFLPVSTQTGQRTGTSPPIQSPWRQTTKDASGQQLVGREGKPTTPAKALRLKHLTPHSLPPVQCAGQLEHLTPHSLSPPQYRVLGSWVELLLTLATGWWEELLLGILLVDIVLEPARGGVDLLSLVRCAMGRACGGGEVWNTLLMGLRIFRSRNATSATCQMLGLWSGSGSSM